MNRTLPLIALLLVSACERQEQPAAPTAAEAPAPPPAPVVKAAVPSLEGKWRVTAPAALDLAISGGKATLSSGCTRRGFTFRQDRNAVVFTSAPSDSTNCGSPPSAADEAAFAALGDANLAVFDGDGRKATLTGLGGMLALERR